MAQDKKLILIPSWIQATLRRNNLPLATCLDLNKIKSIISPNDLALFLAAQEAECVSYLTNIPYYAGALYTAWVDSIIKSDDELLNLFNNTIVPLSTDKFTQSELIKRLFSNDVEVSAADVPFSVHDISPEVFGIVVMPGKFQPFATTYQKDVLEAIIELLYSYHPFHEVAKSPFFKGYLEILSKNIQ